MYIYIHIDKLFHLRDYKFIASIIGQWVDQDATIKRNLITTTRSLIPITIFFQRFTNPNKTPEQQCLVNKLCHKKINAVKLILMR